MGAFQLCHPRNGGKLTVSPFTHPAKKRRGHENFVFGHVEETLSW